MGPTISEVAASSSVVENISQAGFGHFLPVRFLKTLLSVVIGDRLFWGL